MNHPTIAASGNPSTRTRVRSLAVGALVAGLAACGGGVDTVTAEDASDVIADPAVTSGDEAGADGSTDDGSTDGGAAAGSCLAGDEDCTDESYDGQDVVTPVPVSEEPLTGEEAVEGQVDGAVPTPLTGVQAVEDTRLRVAFTGDPCTVVQGAEVVETDDEVRLLLLTGPEQGTDVCAQQVVEYIAAIELESPLGDRTVLDLAG